MDHLELSVTCARSFPESSWHRACTRFCQEFEMILTRRTLRFLMFSLALICVPVFAQEKPPMPYFVVYSHYMEEPDSLDIEVSPAFGRADGIHPFAGVLHEFEYGATRWW